MIRCSLFGHAPSGDHFADLARGGITHAVVDYCRRCGAIVVVHLDQPRPMINRLRPTADIMPLLMRLAPKTKLSELSAALWEQGLEVNTLGLKPLDPVRAPAPEKAEL